MRCDPAWWCRRRGAGRTCPAVVTSTGRHPTPWPTWRGRALFTQLASEFVRPPTNDPATPTNERASVLVAPALLGLDEAQKRMDGEHIGDVGAVDLVGTRQR